MAQQKAAQLQREFVKKQAFLLALKSTSIPTDCQGRLVQCIKIYYFKCHFYAYA